MITKIIQLENNRLEFRDADNNLISSLPSALHMSLPSDEDIILLSTSANPNDRQFSTTIIPSAITDIERQTGGNLTPNGDDRATIADYITTILSNFNSGGGDGAGVSVPTRIFVGRILFNNGVANISTTRNTFTENSLSFTSPSGGECRIESSESEFTNYTIVTVNSLSSNNCTSQFISDSELVVFNTGEDFHIKIEVYEVIS